jgi:hypothetical protein
MTVSRPGAHNKWARAQPRRSGVVSCRACYPAVLLYLRRSSPRSGAASGRVGAAQRARKHAPAQGLRNMHACSRSPEHAPCARAAPRASTTYQGRVARLSGAAAAAAAPPAARKHGRRAAQKSTLTRHTNALAHTAPVPRSLGICPAPAARAHGRGRAPQVRPEQNARAGGVRAGGMRAHACARRRRSAHIAGGATRPRHRSAAQSVWTCARTSRSCRNHLSGARRAHRSTSFAVPCGTLLALRLRQRLRRTYISDTHAPEPACGPGRRGCSLAKLFVQTIHAHSCHVSTP